MTGEGRTIVVGSASDQAHDLSTKIPLSAIAEAIVLSNDHGVITFISSAAAALLGMPAEVAVGQRVEDVLQLSEHAAAPMLPLGEYEGHGTEGVCAAVLSTPTGARRYVEYTASKLDEKSAARLYVIRDVTQRRKLMEQEALLDRLNALSSLVAGVAHEMNNPLAFALGSLELARRTLRTLKGGVNQARQDMLLDRLERAIDTSTQGGTRVAEIVNDLRTFARTSQDTTSLVDVHECIDAAVRLSMHEIRQRARVVRETHARPIVYSSERRLTQLFVNLLIGAAQAMKPGGKDNTIRIAIDATEAGEAVIEISDNGDCIAPSLLPHVFDPLFAPRSSELGSGLGLSVCHEIVAELGGTITAHSDPQGTSFRVVLKSRSSAMESEARQSAVSGVVAKTAQRVLLVDDEPSLVSVFSELLTEEGYEVSSASNGADALALLRGRPPLDVILCDVMMPLMDGIDLYERTAEVAPELATRFVFMTGGATTDRAASFLSTTRQPWISKPIDMRRLLQALERLPARSIVGSGAARLEK